MEFLNLHGLNVFFTQLEKIFGHKSTLDTAMNNRRINLLEIDYDTTLKFDTNWIVGDNAPYVGSAVVGQTYVA